MTKYKITLKERKTLIRILTAFSLFVIVFIIDKTINLSRVSKTLGWGLPLVIYLAIYLLIGYDVLWRAIKNICHGQVLDENFLMCIATIGGFLLAITRGISGGVIEGFDEACAVLIFYQVGEFFEHYATGKTRQSVTELMDIRPDYANLYKDGLCEKVDPETVNEGDLIVVYPGEKIPLDGIVIKGETLIDKKALTGESLPVQVYEGDLILSGTVNITTQITIRVTKGFYDSTVSKILELVENASAKKSKAENFITKFAKYYTPIVVGIAFLLVIIPGWVTGAWSVWLYRALSFLVVSCPCALVISIPLSFFAGIGACSKYGILVKGSNYLEKFDKANIFVFDKTGTLTKGNFEVTKVYPENQKEQVLRLASIGERSSSHPIAKSIISCYNQPVEDDYVLTEVAGQGVIAKKDNSEICCGNQKLMEAKGINYTKANQVGTVVYVAENGIFKGYIIISDQVKQEAKQVVQNLNKSGYKTVMLTGDNEDIGNSVAKTLEIQEFKSGLLPQNKAEEVEKMLAQKSSTDVLCFVGDGINDAPTLIEADVGLSMGGIGSDSAIEASDIVLMNDDLNGISIAKKIARKTMNIVKQNIAFSIGVKVAILILSALGITNMWIAVFGDVGVAVIAILNAMRVNSK